MSCLAQDYCPSFLLHAQASSRQGGQWSPEGRVGSREQGSKHQAAVAQASLQTLVLYFASPYSVGFRLYSSISNSDNCSHPEIALAFSKPDPHLLH